MTVLGLDIPSLAAGFVGGALIGAAGGYYASLFTDRRRGQEAEQQSRREFVATMAKLPDFIAELKAGLAENPAVREFFILPKGTCLGGSDVPRLIFEITDENHYANKMQILENMGYIMDVTPKNTPMYRMTEEFVELVRRHA